MNRIKKLIELLLGKKYYIVVVHRAGTDVYEYSSIMFFSKQEAEDFRLSCISNTRTFEYVETLSVRSRIDYTHVR